MKQLRECANCQNLDWCTQNIERHTNEHGIKGAPPSVKARALLNGLTNVETILPYVVDGSIESGTLVELVARKALPATAIQDLMVKQQEHLDGTPETWTTDANNLNDGNVVESLGKVSSETLFWAIATGKVTLEKTLEFVNMGVFDPPPPPPQAQVRVFTSIEELMEAMGASANYPPDTEPDGNLEC